MDAVAAGRNESVVISNNSNRQTSRTKTDSTKSTSSRSAKTNIVTRQISPRSVTSQQKKIVTGRNATKKNASVRSVTQPTRVVRAAATTNVLTKTFNSNYNSCRDAYFTCMDQFCATQNENYRRCVCSSKLQTIQEKEQKLSQTSDSLKDFENLNIDTISKTSQEVKAMLSATEGESAIKTDTSESSNTLKNISSILDNSKNESLSTQGKLDIAGDIKQIWNTTSLIGGSDIANLTGEKLFNAVHAQCAELVSSSCASSDLQMVSSAYGMYIENDCAVLENNLNTKTTAANAAIRQTRQKMQDARYDNYNAHNSETINQCIASVRQDILTNTACGENYIHCLDFSGIYLNITTGEPIYSPKFYQIENQISLSGDILNNTKNTSFVSALNKKRSFAEKDLDLCRDDADEVWNEFLRQAIVEIYQQQQQRVKTVKEECLQVVNECYLKQSDELKQYTDNSDKINLGLTLELSEEMCADKLNTCSNLYGGGSDGLQLLVQAMTGITTTTIEQGCYEKLSVFAKNVCAVPSSDTLHLYPYGCRKYAPGESMYAYNELCNTTLTNPFTKTELITANQKNSDLYYEQMCINNGYKKRYLSCKIGYYLYDEDSKGYKANAATSCELCPAGNICFGGKAEPQSQGGDTQKIYEQCGEYYIGSLYQQLVIYALQNCRRPSDTTNVLSTDLMMDVDKVAQEVKVQIKIELAKECERQNGIWVDFPYQKSNNSDFLNTDFYNFTGTNVLWG
nr:hypothetical protein [Candidatus Enterousia merdequi]